MHATKKFDVIVVGELNIDLILNELSAFPETGKEVLSKNMTLTLGSSSAIFACNLSVLGAKVAFLGKLGKDIFGSMILAILQSKGVDTSLVIECESLNTGATVVINSGEDRAMITHPGAMEHLTNADIDWTTLGYARHLHLSSYFLQPGIKKITGRLFREAKSAGLTTSFDPQWDPSEKWDLDIEDVLPFVDLFLPNEKEFLNITDTDTLELGIERIRGKANAVIVKLGSKGSVLVYKGDIMVKPAYLNENVIDSIGAGDSFNAGFVYKFLQDAPLESCQEFGNLMGAISTTAAGGTTAFTNKNEIMKHAHRKFKFIQE